MGTSSRSPLLGYNHNVRYRGRVFHVQTEDSGPGNPHLFTHLFFEGSILATKKCDYDGSADEDHVRGLMQGQHKQILKDLKQGDLDDKLTAFFAHRGESFDLDAAASGEMPGRQAEPIQPQPAPSPAAVEPTAGQPPAPSAPVLDLDAVPTPVSAPDPAQPDTAVAPPEPAQPHPIVPTPVPSRRATREIASPFAPTRPGAVAARPVAPVVVQRRVVVGGAHPTPVPPTAPSLRVRVRRPASATPYVVREGSHPNLAARQAAASSQPAAAMANPEPRVAAPPPPPARPSAPAGNQSLDDVILAYLSQGENKG